MASLALSALETLPMELIEHIILLVDQISPPPSNLLLYEPPSVRIFNGTPKASCWTTLSLKSLSETCSHLRYLVAPRLFTHLKVGGEQTQNLVEFCKSSDLEIAPKSILLYLDPDGYPSLELSDVDIDRLRFLRARATWMVNVLNPQILTIVAPPICLGWLIDLPLRMRDCWVSDIPYQMIRLEQGSFAPSQWFPGDVVHDNCTLSTVRPWNLCTYNEGSFMSAYSTYEYHMYEAPCLHQSTSLPELQCHALQLGCLRSFELVALFPFNHMENTIYFLDLLPNLQSLSAQLAPSLECQKQSMIGSSASSPGDFWLELQTSYNLLRHALTHALDHLSTYKILDYTSPGYREIIDSVMRDLSLKDWKPDHNGTWTREVQPSFLNTAPIRRNGLICPSMERCE